MIEAFFDGPFLRAPTEWGPGDVERARQEFRDRRPAVPRYVVEALWRFWRLRQPDRALFDDPEQDLALVLHAQAYGLELGLPDPADPLAALLSRIDGAAECSSLTPAVLTWGPQAALATEVRAALGSTLVRAWIVLDRQGPIEALVVGAGLPEIRQQIVQFALMTSLRINGLADVGNGAVVGDLVNVGLIRISAGLPGQAAAVELPPVFNAQHVTVAESSAVTARGALRDFVNGLRSLERETNLVEIAEITSEQAAGLADTIRDMAEQVVHRPGRVLLRPAVDDRDAAGDGDEGVVGLLPLLSLADSPQASAGTGIALHLHADLLATVAYTRLEEAHQRVLTTRLTLDAQLRRDQIKADLTWMTTEHDEYLLASPEERAANWDPVVLLVEKFDDRTGTTITLAEPEEMSRDQYELVQVPNLIKLREAWLRRLDDLVDNLRAAAGQPHSPARQLAAGRFFDAVLRDETPDESPATASAFEQWAAQLAPMLRFEWRHELNRRRIDPRDVFTRHTTFVTRYLPAIGPDDAVLVMLPHSLVDDRLSAVLADADRRVMVVRDGTDHGTSEIAGANDNLDGPAAEQEWNSLARLADDPETGEDVFAGAFISLLRKHPRHTARRMVETLQPPAPDPAEPRMMEDELRRAAQAMSLSEGMSRARTAMRMSAFLTARQILDHVRAAPRGEAQAWLLRSVVECVATDLPQRDIPGLLGSRTLGTLPHAALRAVDEAAHLDADYTARWLADLPEITVHRAVQRLFHGVPHSRSEVSGRERAVWLFRSSLQSARLAGELEEAVEELPEDRMPIDAALVALGRVLEDVLVGQYTNGARGEAERLLEVLTGEERPRYGDVTGA
ncbi:hypothetical protein [Actinoplanes sp. NPDC049265]|uniref:hypothetical protein n=1 Tax=Actinoplanes sp. NPDC049265 TaxID=3363902 RepID=UPI00371523F5